jgi:DNA-binding NarL/FixJ family response regulator
MPTIRVMIVDDYQTVRVSLARALEIYDDIEVVGEAASGEEALVLCEYTLPDVVLMDLMLPGIDGVATTHAIKQRNPKVQVLALTAHEEPDLVTQTLQAGARGFLLKNVTGQILHQAIRSVNAGQAVLAPEVANNKNNLS